MTEHDGPALDGLGLEPEDLDGHTIEELSDYLDAGRTPPDPAIEASAGCRIALDALQRLRGFTTDLVAADEAAEPEPDEGWVRGILAGITSDARAGRRIPLAPEEHDADLGITEGAVRGLIRAAEDAVPGVLVGRCRLDGDVTLPGMPIPVRVDVSVAYGARIPDAVAGIREEIAAILAAHTDLVVAAIDITVRDIHQLADPTKEDS
ncbi:MAG: hypothetical protein ACTHZX_02330 [Microbacterium sp.]